MGSNCDITLPGDARGRDIAEVIGILSGLNPEWTETRDTRWVTVPGASFEKGHAPECPEIIIHGDLVDGTRVHYVVFHYEWGTGSNHGMSPPSTPFWCAVAHSLVWFFGGSVDYDDCDNTDVDFRRESPRQYNNPDDGEAWDSFQNEMMAIKPLSPQDIAAFKKYAAYKD